MKNAPESSPRLKKIYVAEDDPQQRQLVKAMLAKNKTTESTLFSDGLKLYQSIQEDPPDLVISDILLPSLSGLALARLLKIQEEFQSIPILIVSAVTEKDIEKRVKAQGAEAFLSKPLKINEFLAVVERLIRDTPH